MADETTGFPADDKDAQIAELKAALAQATVAATVQADQAASADAGVQLAQMSTDRPERLPAEDDHDRLMAEMKAMSERLATMEGQLSQARSDYAAATAKLGPPEVATYARAIFDKLVSFRNAHPDLPGHFDRIIDRARPLADAAQNVLEGRGHVSDVVAQLEDVVAAVERFVSRTHPRQSGKPIDFSALESDLEDAVDAAGKLAQVA